MKRTYPHFLVVCGLFPFILLAACTPAPEQTAAPPSRPPPASPAPPTRPAPNVTCSELSFYLDPGLGSGVECVTVPESSSSDISMDIFIYPTHTELAIEGYPLPRAQFEPMIFVYPIGRFSELLPDVIPGHVSDLQLVLSGGTPASLSLPFLPPLPMEQTFFSHHAVRSFNGGQGVRFISDYHDLPHPVTNRTLIYTFQGLTEDGAYWLGVTFPLSSPALPADDQGIDWLSESWLQDFPAYAAEVKGALDAQPPGSFSPAIERLDELVSTITINPSKAPAAEPEAQALLPHALYFLAGSQGEAQVWRLDPDGESRQQITHVQNGVNEFAVSPGDGRIAVISDNRLFLMSTDGETKSLIADGHTVDPNVEDYVFRSQVSAPVFSPDGRTLAYGFNGLHLYDLASGEDTHVLTNLGNLLGEPFVFSREAYFPGPWSPDGRRLLIIMGYYEGSTLAVMEPDAEPLFRRLRSDGPVCCLFNWSSDGESVLVANPYFTVDLPGLWRFDAETGVQSTLVPGLDEDGSIRFVGWPLVLESGDLFYFHVNLPRFSPDTGIPLTLVRSELDGSNPVQVRPEAFRILDALWVEDGSAAVILQWRADGIVPVVLMRTDGRPLEVLLEASGIRRLMWGP